MGRSIEGFVAVLSHAAIRIHNFPRLLEEVVEIGMIPLRSVHKLLGLIVQNGLSRIKIEIPTRDYQIFWCTDLVPNYNFRWRFRPNLRN